MGEHHTTRRGGTDPTENQQRLTVHEAARLFGISEDAVRMRVKRGTLDAEREGRRLYVLLTPEPTTEPTNRELIDELMERAHYLERMLEEERRARTEERRRHDTLMAQLMQRIPQLEAPTEPRESPETVSETSDSAEHRSAAPGSQEGTQRPWWRRWFGSS